MIVNFLDSQKFKAKKNQVKQDIRSAQEICKKSMEHWDESKKLGELETILDKTPRKGKIMDLVM